MTYWSGSTGYIYRRRAHTLRFRDSLDLEFCVCSYMPHARMQGLLEVPPRSRCTRKIAFYPQQSQFFA